jgi:hypothetical protein
MATKLRFPVGREGTSGVGAPMPTQSRDKAPGQAGRRTEPGAVSALRALGPGTVVLVREPSMAAAAEYVAGLLRLRVHRT